MPLKLFDNTFNLLEYSMNVRSAMHDVISSNIANIDTPGYKCKNVNFQKELDKYIKKDNIVKLTVTNKKHIQINQSPPTGYSPEIEICKTHVFGNDKNNVDLDKEMAKMSKNHLLYNVDSQIIAKEFKILKDTIINAGR